MADQENLPKDKNGAILKIGDKIKKIVCSDPEFLFTVTDIQEGFICIDNQILMYDSHGFCLSERTFTESEIRAAFFETGYAINFPNYGINVREIDIKELIDCMEYFKLNPDQKY